MLPAFILTLAILGGLLYRYWTRAARRDARALAQPFPAEWSELLRRRVSFYRDLPTPDDRTRFEQRVQLFLARTRLTGIETAVDDATRLLVAAAAVIPIWGLPDWEYPSLREVLIVPDAWQSAPGHDEEFAPLRGTVLGSVQRFQGSGQYMRLSKASLERGFRDWQNGENVGLHEFAHLLDDADGTIDGGPALLRLSPARLGAWRVTVKQELARVQAGNGILDPYAGTNEAELFAVAIETFFEDPDRLARHHPELYALLAEGLNQQPNGRRFPHLPPGRAQRRGGRGADSSGRGA